MNNLLKLTALSLIFSLADCNQTSTDPADIAKESLEVAAQQLAQSIDKLENSNENPRTIRDGALRTVRARDWTSGFYPGCLWYMFEHTGDEKFLEAAKHYTMNVEQMQFYDGTHDLGFMMYCSFGNGFRLTGKSVAVIEKPPDEREVLREIRKALGE